MLKATVILSFKTEVPVIKSADDIVLDIKLGYFADGWSQEDVFYRDNIVMFHPLKLTLKMKMNKKQYNDPKKDLTAVFAKHKFDPVLCPVVGQREVEKQQRTTVL